MRGGGGGSGSSRFDGVLGDDARLYRDRRATAAAATGAGGVGGGGGFFTSPDGRARRHRTADAACPGRRKRNTNGPDLDRLTERQRLRAGDALALDEGAVGRQIAHHQALRP